MIRCPIDETECVDDHYPCPTCGWEFPYEVDGDDASTLKQLIEKRRLEWQNEQLRKQIAAQTAQIAQMQQQIETQSLRAPSREPLLWVDPTYGGSPQKTEKIVR